MLLSAIGALLFLPMYFFLGGVFSFWFAARDSMWAWGFNLTAFWCQIFGITASFFKPRTGAVWMLLNIALSVLMAIGCAAESIHDFGWNAIHACAVAPNRSRDFEGRSGLLGRSAGAGNPAVARRPTAAPGP